MQSDIEAGFLGVKELAQKLAVSTRSVWRLVAAGEFRPVRIGRRTVVSKAEVAKWLAGKEAPTPSENVPISDRG